MEEATPGFEGAAAPPPGGEEDEEDEIMDELRTRRMTFSGADPATSRPKTFAAR